MRRLWHILRQFWKYDHYDYCSPDWIKAKRYEKDGYDR